uniref:Uncharacterized protein n=1 Tax=Candidatus Hydrogenisulfobacillus filiaventi TaxID=2707344 RepID=A0A6F8ZDG6_9FIRM|nr:conserved protein of unknown function [Candidatus Hydrogenisulfobacillus filiaventi]
MDEQPNPSAAFARIAQYIRWTADGLILAVIVLTVLGLLISWAPHVPDPPYFVNHFRAVVEDLFAVVVLLEVRDLLKTLRPLRLLDLVGTFVARKIALTESPTPLLLEVAALAVLLAGRALWMWAEARSGDHLRPHPPAR